MTFNIDKAKTPIAIKTTKPTINRRPRIKVTITVTVKVLDEAKPDEVAKSAAYIFSKGGSLLGKANLNSKGTAEIDVNLPVLETTQSFRVIAGPNLPEKQTIAELLALGANRYKCSNSSKNNAERHRNHSNSKFNAVDYSLVRFNYLDFLAATRTFALGSPC